LGPVSENQLEIVEFCGLPILVSEAVMTPRPSSEVLVNTACDCIVESCRRWVCRSEGRAVGPCGAVRTPRILDLGTGSGALLIGILVRLSHIEVKGVGLDICQRALTVARRNVSVHGLEAAATLVQGDFSDLSCVHVALEAISPGVSEETVLRDLDHALPSSFACPESMINSDGFDAVICNPPYLTQKEAARIATELRGPPLAMIAEDVGHVKGASAYWSLAKGIAGSAGLLREGGSVIVELGGRRDPVVIAQIFRDVADLELAAQLDDHHGFCRCLRFVEQVKKSP
jgi:methylase of polypeptide subunit release factors